MASSGWTVRRAVNKPWYVYRPMQIPRRLLWQLRSTRAEEATVPLPWGLPLIVKQREVIGSSVGRTGVHDLAVTEAAFRLLDAGDVAIDAGANIGYMTSVMAARIGPAGRVHAFEPHPVVLGLLERNVSAWRGKGGAAEVEVHPVALSDDPGHGMLTVPESFAMNMGLATLDPTDGVSELSAVEVTLATLDERLRDRREIGLLKLDVEGHEQAVLRGAHRLLGEGRIRDVLFEEHGVYPTPVSRMLEAAGYEMLALRVDLTGLQLLDPLDDDGRGDYDGRNYLATTSPARARVRIGRGWQVLRRRRR
jgi:FkbM family methyltransferase